MHLNTKHCQSVASMCVDRLNSYCSLSHLCSNSPIQGIRQRRLQALALVVAAVVCAVSLATQRRLRGWCHRRHCCLQLSVKRKIYMLPTSTFPGFFLHSLPALCLPGITNNSATSSRRWKKSQRTKDTPTTHWARS